MIESVFHDPILMAFWAGITTGALIHEVLIDIFEYRVSKAAGMNGSDSVESEE